jgi:hypothetical protein
MDVVGGGARRANASESKIECGKSGISVDRFYSCDFSLKLNLSKSNRYIFGAILA